MLRSVVPESLTVDAGSRCEEREPDNEDLELPRSKRARVRLLSHRSLKEEVAEGGCSEYEEITVEVDGDYLFTEEEEESFETEEVTYQLKVNSDNELDSESEVEHETSPAPAGGFLPEQVLSVEMNGAKDFAPASLTASPSPAFGGECPSETQEEEASEGREVLVQATPFIVSDIKEEVQAKEQSVASTEQKLEEYDLSPEYLASMSPLEIEQIESLQENCQFREIGAESGEIEMSQVQDSTNGSSVHLLLNAEGEESEPKSLECESKQRLCQSAEVEEESGERDACPLCAEAGEVFYAGQNEMATHFVQVHNIMDQGYECTECGYKSRHRSHLKDHINAMHLEAKFKCDLCDYETKYKNRIKSHRVSVHKIGGLPCPSCPYVASEPWVLSQHMKLMHKVKDGAGTDVTMFKCNYCDYQSLQKSHMRCHERAIHKQVLLTCELCGYQSKWKSRLNSHIKAKHLSLFIHCDHCDFKATERFALKVHIRKQHGDITFACFKCGEDFITRLDLKRHLSDVHFMEIV